MNFKRITHCLLLLPTLVVFSQTSFHSESHQVTLADIKTNTFERDTTANAVIIYEHGKSWVHPGTYKLMTNEIRKIKILKKEGFGQATVKLFLHKKSGNDYQKVENIVGTTYNMVDGNVVKSKLNKEDIFEEDYNENYNLVTFTLPNLKEGSVISYSYTLTTPQYLMWNYKGWDFQHKIPTLYSEYETSIPGNWEYNIKLVGGKKLAVNTVDVKNDCLEIPAVGKANCLESVYAMKDIPAFIEEDYMTTEDNYLARVEYELKTFRGFDGIVTNYTKEWRDVDKELKTDPNIGKQLSKSIKLEDILPLNLINSINSKENATLIYEHIQQNYIWNEKLEIFKNVSVKDLIKDKSGNVGSINILLHNTLNEKGYNVKPLLISTRQNGHPTTIYPIISDFNYLVVHLSIDGETYLLDATDKYLSFDEIPFRCLNQYGRLLDFNSGSDWYDIVPKKSDVLYEAKLHIDNNGDIVGDIVSKRTGYHAYNHRKSYFSNASAYIENLHNNAAFIDISNHNTIESSPTTPVFQEQYHVEYQGEETGDNIYLNPFFVKFFSENPFKLQERSYPIDFGYQDSYYYTLKLDLGGQYEILEKPKPLVTSLPNKAGMLFYSSSTFDNELSLTFRIDFKEAVYAPEYYPYLKKFMNKIVDAQNNSLILLKKK
ncbi:DUF3857 domain-containing protein [Seonamhaeicola aphaedonensis]|uniref:Uncharacterized protein DUF3857 n=1 Tax=Seonamhaeicola aphaedonensis TaxID=1461338 RepID=A0A3D9H9U2_9FLAO|nr:DUF3857 domain-containing protein [Seonamhaeicola aphaedonensis]RED45951.1 uncharacterized protein DUF3857 [Seonamhaeicola aphaedonensis]